MTLWLALKRSACQPAEFSFAFRIRWATGSPALTYQFRRPLRQRKRRTYTGALQWLLGWLPFAGGGGRPWLFVGPDRLGGVHANERTSRGPRKAQSARVEQCGATETDQLGQLTLRPTPFARSSAASLPDEFGIKLAKHRESLPVPPDHARFTAPPPSPFPSASPLHTLHAHLEKPT
jgi:hypothetical protein